MVERLTAPTASKLTAESIMEWAREWAKRPPECVAVFEWHLAPHDYALQFCAPLTELSRTMLGPYAPDLSEALQDAREGDFAIVVHPVSLKRAFPSQVAKVQTPGGVFGIPVRELRRDPEWAPIIVDYGLADYGKWFLREDEKQKEALDLPRPLIEPPTYGEPLRETVQRIQDELHQAYRDAGGEPDA